MVPRPGTTSPEDGLRIKQEPEAQAPSITGPSTAFERATRPTAPRGSEGTPAAGHPASDDEEAYEQKFAVPDVAPAGVTLGLGSRQDPAGSRSVKTESLRNTAEEKPLARLKLPEKPATTRSGSKSAKKMMRAPDTDVERSPRKPTARKSDAEFTSSKLERGLDEMALLQALKKNPILQFLQPTLVGELTGPVLDPDVASLTSVLPAVHAAFNLLRDAGFAMGVFDMEQVFGWDVEAWKGMLTELFDPLSQLVGVIPNEVEPPRSPRGRSNRVGSTGSSRYQSVSSGDSDSSEGRTTRMTMPLASRPLPKRRGATRTTAASKLKPSRSSPAWHTTPPPAGIEEAFAKMMRTYTARQAPTPVRPTPAATPPAEDQDESMASVSSGSRAGRGRSAYPAEDPEDFFDLGVGEYTRPNIAAAAAASAATPLTRVRMSAFSELKEFSGRESGDEKARSWFNRVRSAARRDGMGPEEVCSLFGDLMTGPARQWYLQLGREVRASWEKLTEQFLVQYCGKGVSMASRYYHAIKRSDESPLDYLYRLNVAGIRAGLHFMEGSADQKREHVDHYVRTLSHQEPELGMQLTMLMVPDVPSLERVLRKRQRSLESQKKTLFGSNKYRQKDPAPPAPRATQAPARAIHALQGQDTFYDPDPVDSDSDQRSEYDQDRDEVDRAQVHVLNTSNSDLGQRREGRTEEPGRPTPRPPCRHCQSTRHADADCWKILTCNKCGGHHPTDRCLRVCKACGDVHDAGQCPMEEFFNLLRQWYNPQKHAGMLPPTAEQMLN